MSEAVQTIRNALFERFGERFEIDPALPGARRIGPNFRPPRAPALS
jgi:hypothetical protein